MNARPHAHGKGFGLVLLDMLFCGGVDFLIAG